MMMMMMRSPLLAQMILGQMNSWVTCVDSSPGQPGLNVALAFLPVCFTFPEFWTSESSDLRFACVYPLGRITLLLPCQLWLVWPYWSLCRVNWSLCRVDCQQSILLCCMSFEALLSASCPFILLRCVTRLNQILPHTPAPCLVRGFA